MGTINQDSPFISYNLSEQEILQGQILGDLNKQVLQNLLFMAVMEKINIPRTPETLQLEAELAGRIGILQAILDNHRAAIAQLHSPEQQVAPEPNPDISGIFPRARMSSGGISFPSDNS